MNAGDVCTAARDLHPAFDHRRHPQVTLYRFLTRYQRELVAKAVLIDETFGALSETVALPLADFAAGITLPTHQYLLGGSVVGLNNADAINPLTILPWGNRFQRAREPSSYVLGGVLFLRGIATDWLAYGSVTIVYTPVVGIVASDSTTLALPDTALAVLVNAAGAFMGGKGHADPNLPKINAQKMAEDWQQSENAWLNDISEHRAGKSNQIREVRSFS